MTRLSSSSSVRHGHTEIPFWLVDDPAGTFRLESFFESYWTAYRRWMARAPDIVLRTRLAKLTEHMPELVQLFEQLHARFGGSDEVGRFLTLYRPPRVVRACTQLVLQGCAGPVLLRSYDHAPQLMDGIVLRADWGGVGTLAMTDCLWGALDGINDRGLAIALAFGGRNTVGHGFAPSLICRYVLQTCSTVGQARAVLARLPVYMPYTFVVLDGAGDFVTAFLSPDKEAAFVTRRASANHQGGIDWPQYAGFVQTVERQAAAEALLEGPSSLEQARRAFLSPPVWRTNYEKASGTLYVAEYAPAAKTLDLHWPGHTEHIGFATGFDRRFTVSLPDACST